MWAEWYDWRRKMDTWNRVWAEWGDLSKIESPEGSKRYDRTRVEQETKWLLTKPLPWKWNTVSLAELRASQQWNKLFDRQLKHTPMGQEEFYRARKNPDITNN